MMRPVTTDRLLLRSFTAADLDDLHDIHRRSEVARYLFWHPRDREATRDALDVRIGETDLIAEGENLAIAVVLRRTGRLIGDFNLMFLSAELGRAEIGFVLNPDHSGRGLAVEAGQAVLRMAFESHGFHRVIGRCNGDNHPSRRLMSRLGMRQEAFFVQGEMLKGERVDLAVYAILAEEWRRSRKG